jgi:hypothetical protein
MTKEKQHSGEEKRTRKKKPVESLESSAIVPIADTALTKEIPMTTHHHEVPTQEVIIQGRTFQAPAPYAEGHTINGAEAAALNTVLKENLRNNFAGLMKRAAEEAEPRILTQADFDAYAAEYDFGARRTRNVIADPVEREEKKITEAAVKRALMKKGFKLKELSEELIAAHVKNVMATGRYRADAERAIANKKAMAELEL